MSSPLPSGYTLRPPTLDDLEAVTALLNACAQAEYGTADVSSSDILADWQHTGFALETDAWLVLSQHGQVVGYADVLQAHGLFYSYARTHPAHAGWGIATHLLNLLEARARQMLAAAPQARPILRTIISSTNLAAQHLLEQRGYRLVRHFWRMETILEQSPPAPTWPAGISVHTLAPGEDIHPVYHAIEDAFQDHWEYHPTPFEVWEQDWIQRKQFDPALWFLAQDGQELAGVALCRYRAGVAWVSQLAVRRPWRKHGLGLALLQHALGEFYRRGERIVGLSVDAENLTGATRLYEKAGMRPVQQLDHYERPLQPHQVQPDSCSRG